MAVEMPQLAECLLGKCEDPSLNLSNHVKSRACQRTSVILELLRWRETHPRGLLDSQCSKISEHQVQ